VGGRHYQSGAKQALPAIALAVGAAVGSVGNGRWPRLRLLVRVDPGNGSEAELQHRAVPQAGATWHADDVLVVDAGCGGADLLPSEVPRFVARVARTFPARRHRLPPYKGRGRCPVYGERVRPLPRQRQGQLLAATPPDAPAHWVGAGRRIRAQVGANLVVADAKPGATACRCVVIHDPRYQEPWVGTTNLPVSA
jgi:hypothetical protein